MDGWKGKWEGAPVGSEGNGKYIQAVEYVSIPFPSSGFLLTSYFLRKNSLPCEPIPARSVLRLNDDVDDHNNQKRKLEKRARP